MNKEVRYCLLSDTLLACNEITVYEKIVFARMSGFETFFEAPEKTAQFLNISTDKVRKAKQKLEKLGFITCIENTPKGKKYRIKSLNEIEAILGNEITEPSDEPSFDAETLTEPNKGLKTQNNEEAKPLNDNTLAFMAWEEIMGVKINKNIKFNRFSCNRLVKKYGLETVKKYISLAKAGLGERYCPNCYNFIDLEQKLPALLAWGKEKYEKKGKAMMTLEDL